MQLTAPVCTRPLHWNVTLTSVICAHSLRSRFYQSILMSFSPSTMPGPPEVLEQLQAVGVKVLTIPDEPSIEGVYRKIRYIAGILGREQRGEQLISDMEAGIPGRGKCIKRS